MKILLYTLNNVNGNININIAALDTIKRFQSFKYMFTMRNMHGIVKSIFSTLKFQQQKKKLLTNTFGTDVFLSSLFHPFPFSHRYPHTVSMVPLTTAVTANHEPTMIIPNIIVITYIHIMYILHAQIILLTLPHCSKTMCLSK